MASIGASNEFAYSEKRECGIFVAIPPFRGSTRHGTSPVLESPVNLYQRMEFLVRAWKYRISGEKFGLSFVRNSDLADQTVLDIGANRGIYSYWLHQQVGAKGRVFAFEPQPELAAQLGALKSAFGLAQLEVVSSGVSSECGELQLRRPRGHWAGASFERFKTGRDDVEVIRTPVTTLDQYFANRTGGPIRFIKCDVEGHELDVFRGAANILATDRPDLLFECTDRDVPDCPVFTYLNTLGYVGYCFAQRDFAPVSEYRSLQLHKRAQRDFVFLPRERAYGALRRCA